jgi:ABC-type uncharacterized transport system involved in gliding motility auxiliary subunit
MSKRFSLALWKTGGSLFALAALLVLLIALNSLCGRIVLRWDLTEEKLFTLSPGSRNLVGKLDRPVVLKFFSSTSAPEIPGPFKAFSRQVEDLLREYVRISQGRVTLEKYDPQPDSDAEEMAHRFGIQGQPLGMMGPTLYLGVVAVSGAEQQMMPVIDPRTEEMLEYNLTRMIARVAHPQRPVIGVLSSLPVLGSDPSDSPPMGGPRPTAQPPWLAFQGLKEDYQVRPVPSSAITIAPDITTLVVVHPKNLSEETLFAIDQFVLRGGRLLAFVDPLCVSDESASGGMQGMSMPRASSDLPRLFNTWGITYDSSRVIADIDAGTTVRGRDNQPEQSPLFLSLDPTRFNSSEVALASLDSLLLPFAGVFEVQKREGLTSTVLLRSSSNAQRVSALMAGFGSDNIRRDFKSEQQAFPLAIRLSGVFQTAFPEGRPKTAGAETNALATVETPRIQNASDRPGLVVVVGDVDCLANSFCVREMNFLGASVNQPFNDNIALFANLIDQTAGGTDLIGIRSRGKSERPFTRVVALARQAQEQHRVREQELEKKVQTLQQRLGELQSRKDDHQKFILSPEQEKAIANFRAQMLASQQELRQVRKRLREGIEQLGLKIKIINIVGVPLLVALIGLSVPLVRRIRARRRLSSSTL